MSKTKASTKAPARLQTYIQQGNTPEVHAALAATRLGWENMARQPPAQRGSPEEATYLTNRKAMIDEAMAQQYRDTRRVVPSIKGAIKSTKDNRDAMFARYAAAQRGESVTTPPGMVSEAEAYARILVSQREALENARIRAAQSENRSTYSGTEASGNSFTRLTPQGELQGALEDTVEQQHPRQQNPYADMDLAILNGIQEAAQRGELGGTPQVVNDPRLTMSAATQRSKELRQRAIIKLLRANGVQGVPEVFEDGSVRLPGVLARAARRLPGVLI